MTVFNMIKQKQFIKNILKFNANIFVLYFAFFLGGVYLHLLIVNQKIKFDASDFDILTVGLSFDLFNAGTIILLLLPIIILPKFFQLLIGWFAVASFYIFQFVDYHYVLNFESHLPYSIIEYSSDISTLLPSLIPIVFSYSCIHLIILPVAFFCVIYYKAVLFSPKKKPVFYIILVFVSLLIVSVISGGYSNKHYAQNPNDPLTFSSLSYFYWTKNFKNQKKIVKPVASLEKINTYLPGISISKDISEHNPLIKFQKANSCLSKKGLSEFGQNICNEVFHQKSKPNIIIIILESFRNADIGAFGNNKGLTEEFDKWAKKGILFENFYANGFQTRHGQMATYCSILPNYGDSISRYYSKNNFECLPEKLKSIGYHTSWYIGDSGAYDNQTDFFKKNGFQKVIDLSSFPSDVPKSGWGVFDEELFKKNLQDIESLPEPFFTSVRTVTNHHPFEIPSEYILNKVNSDKARYYNALRYTDIQLGKYLEIISKQPWYHNTIVFVLADHSNFQKVNKEPDNFDEYISIRSKIPLLVLGGKIKQRKKIREYSSQIDISPTIMDIIGEPYVAPWNGRSLLKKTNYPIAFTLWPGKYWGIMSEYGRYYNENNWKDHFFEFKDNQLKQEYKSLSRSWIKTIKWLLQEDQVWKTVDYNLITNKTTLEN